MYAFKFFLSLHFVGGVLVPFFTQWGGISFSQLMFIQSFFVFSVFVLEIPTGAVADYFGRKTSVILAVIANIVGVIIYSSYPNFYLFLLAEFFWALGGTLLSGADQAFLYDSLKEEKREKESKQIFAQFTSFERGAAVVGAPIGSIIAATFGLRYTMMFMVIPMFIAFLIALSFEEPNIKQEKKQDGYFKTITSGVKYFKIHKELKILAFDNISVGVLASFLIWTYQPLLKKLDMPLIYWGLIFAAIAGVQILFMNNFSRLEKIFGSKKKYLFWSAILSGIGFVLLGFSEYVWFTVSLIILIAGFGLSRGVLFKSYFNKYIESENRSTVISVVSMIRSFVRMLLYPLVGFLVEWSLNYSVIILGTAIIIFAFISRVEEKHLQD